MVIMLLCPELQKLLFRVLQLRAARLDPDVFWRNNLGRFFGLDGAARRTILHQAFTS